MPEEHNGLYSASCNPPRGVKRSSAIFFSSPSFTQPRAILPMRPYAPRPPTSPETTLEPPPLPAKRGRKPGPLSRTAREAQRRLNHSIIEKARRTKINDALATLKELVPVGYGQVKPPPAESADPDDEDEDDDEYTDGTKKAKPKSKGTGKKEEKEKEFKLEILVRTVSFLQDLLKRVADLEATGSAPSTCQNCSVASNPSEKSTKRKRIHLEDHDEDHNRVQETAYSTPSRGAKAPRVSETSSSNAKIPQDVPISPTSLSHPSTPVFPPPAADAARLPSISSWLPNSVIDPQLLPPSNRPSSSPHMGSYLPSPPSSTHVDPVRTSHIPPVLSLGPVATAAMVNAPRSATSPTTTTSRTAEDESAASLLLQIRAGSSPNFRPVPSSPSSASAYGLPDPSNFLLHSDVRSQREGNHVRQAQTPGSMLGMNVSGGKF
jgi:hypothetical protein